jgi:hypothetical protein
MANGAVCHSMYAQLVMTFRHPYISKAPYQRLLIQKVMILRRFSSKKCLNMAQVAHLFQGAPHYRVPENSSFVKYSLRQLSNFS